MRKFIDLFGREWVFEVNVGSVMQVKQQNDLLLPSLFDDELKPMTTFLKDVIKVVDVMWTLVEPQAKFMKWKRPVQTENGQTLEDAIGVSPIEFAQGLAGDTLEQATEALLRSVGDFFSSPEQREGALGILELMIKTGREFAKETVDLINKIDPALMAKNCLNSVTNGQELPGLIQKTSRQAS